MDIEKRNARIRAHAKALPKRVPDDEWVNMNYHVWMPLARRWKMSIMEIKAIVRGRDGPKVS